MSKTEDFEKTISDILKTIKENNPSTYSIAMKKISNMIRDSLPEDLKSLLKCLSQKSWGILEPCMEYNVSDCKSEQMIHKHNKIEVMTAIHCCGICYKNFRILTPHRATKCELVKFIEEMSSIFELRNAVKNGTNSKKRGNALSVELEVDYYAKKLKIEDKIKVKVEREMNLKFEELIQKKEEEFDQQIVDMKRKVDQELKNRQKEMDQEIKKYKAKNELLEKEIKKCKVQNSTVIEVDYELVDEKLQNELKETKNQLTHFKSLYENSQDICNKNTIKLEDVTKELEAKRQEVENVNKDLNNAKKEIKDLKQIVHEAKSHVIKLNNVFKK